MLQNLTLAPFEHTLDSSSMMLVWLQFHQGLGFTPVLLAAVSLWCTSKPADHSLVLRRAAVQTHLSCGDGCAAGVQLPGLTMPQTALASELGEGPEASCSIELASPADTAWNEVSTRQRAGAAPVGGAVCCGGQGRAAAAAAAAQAGDGHSAEDAAGAAVTHAEAGAGSGGLPQGEALSRPGSRCSDLHWSSEAAFAIMLASPRSQGQPSRASTAAAEAEEQPMGQQEGPGQPQRQPAQVSQPAAGPRQVCWSPLLQGCAHASGGACVPSTWNANAAAAWQLMPAFVCRRLSCSLPR